MKIAVTSASGQLGNAIIIKAIDRFGHENVVGLARTVEKAKDLGVEIRKGDYNEPTHFVEALKGIDVVVILSGNDAPDNRIGQHRNIINGAKVNGVRKIVYTSIIGELGKCKFDAIIESNRQTEQDIKDSGLDYAIGRNGLYLEADIEAIPDYKKEGKIANSAGTGKVGYTTREELADAYCDLIEKDALNGSTYNLFGELTTQQELTNAINEVYGTELVYEALSIEDYYKDRIAAYNGFFGGVIGGIYEGIHNGTFNVVSDFEKVTGRMHQGVKEFLKQTKM